MSRRWDNLSNARMESYEHVRYSFFIHRTTSGCFAKSVLSYTVEITMHKRASRVTKRPCVCMCVFWNAHWIWVGEEWYLVWMSRGREVYCWIISKAVQFSPHKAQWLNKSFNKTVPLNFSLLPATVGVWLKGFKGGREVGQLKRLVCQCIIRCRGTCSL